jgi:two-component system sensor histidine kinase RpfC
MTTDIVEGAFDKSEAGLRSILLAQAKLRVLIAVPVALTEAVLYVMAPDSVASRLVWLTGGYCAYIVILQLLVRYRVPARHLLAATAVLDPLALSAWLMVTGEYGALITGFYLFTILGFGFRTGRPLMYLCQATALVGFALAFLVVPYWQERPVTWGALLLPLVAVPMYAGTLIKRLREAREHAERESQAKSELLAKVSHELRTPLTGIISATELLAAEAGSPAVSRRTDTILALSNELLQEINDLLDEAKYGARALELSNSPVDLADHIALVRNTLDAMAAKKGIDLLVALDPKIADRVETDAHLLGRVLLNLAGNAVKFTDHGSVAVTIELLQENDDEYRLRFAVNDTGIGIPEEFHARLFQPFSQVDQGASRRYGGTGLGLTLSQKIVELMGGTLSFESQAGQGSRFWFDLTLRRCAPAKPVVAPAASTSPAPAPRRILVAEDNETNLLLLQELLEKDGHDVATCASGLAALELLAERDFDLLLLDYNLGDMDGVRVLQTYRFGRRDPAPALFLTADTTKLTAARLKEADAAGVLYKPITLGKLRNAIREVEASLAARGDSFEQVSEVAESAEPSRATRPALAAVSISALDREVIDELKTVSSRREFFPMLLGEAENDMLRNSQLILDSLAQSNYASIRDYAHALKGVSANVGAVRLQALAAKIMTTPRDELDAARERWASDLKDTLRLTVAALKKEVRDAGDEASAGGATSLHLK